MYRKNFYKDFYGIDLIFDQAPGQFITLKTNFDFFNYSLISLGIVFNDITWTEFVRIMDYNYNLPKDIFIRNYSDFNLIHRNETSS
jgi:hypothetical protein